MSRLPGTTHGERVRLADFEDSGPGDRAFELAILVEHRSVRADAGLDGEAFLASFGLTAAEHARVAEVGGWPRCSG